METVDQFKYLGRILSNRDENKICAGAEQEFEACTGTLGAALKLFLSQSGQKPELMATLYKAGA